MAFEQRRGGIIELKVDGSLFSAKGNFTYNLGKPKRDAIVGTSEIPGYKETPQVPFIEGEFTDNVDVDLEALVTYENATLTLRLANGKTIVLRDAWYAAEGTGNTDEGNIQFRFEGLSAEEIT
ncbi:phage tail tube protein [Bradyrhizobium sp.]|uniref:phage tail tube protein n=1 Tax=Bradyrhizobium sp. TaxID=376 RepID=UPI0039E41F23